MTNKQKKVLLYGSDEDIKIERNLSFKFKGVATSIDWVYEHERYRRECSPFMGDAVCPVCLGSRLKPESMAVTIDDKSIIDLVNMPIGQASKFFDKVKLTERQREIGSEVLKEIQGRLSFLTDVGLNYLTLGRNATTLSGGEAERIRLASQLGCGLAGVLYVLDEPSVGLHQRDNNRLLKALRNLRDLGNTVMIVEHDHEAIISSDYMIDFGPGAGVHGGEIVAFGTPEEVINKNGSLTAQYLSGKKKIQGTRFRRPIGDSWLEIIGAREHNLKNIDVKLPLGVFTCVTGVSGSGKSSLINDILYKSLARRFHRANTIPGAHDSIAGLKYINKVINIDQTPLGDTPRSNPATYTEVFSDIRQLYAEMPEARMLGIKARRFSFNVKGGQCEACEGNGYKRIQMHFLADVWVKCDVCHGTRYKKDVLEVKYKGKNISEVLDMTASEALEFFKNIPNIRKKLQVLCDVGLSYIQLGQSSTTLSGGEAQRVKLSKELSRPSTGKTLYLLDEPTTGLHFDDIQKLLTVLNSLVDKGNTVVVIEHNLDVIKNADYIIDLGPEGGDEGGNIVACGTPEEVAMIEESHTGRFIRDLI
ncbi:TPA: excinuclease ABC subunit A [bacterium]|nr:excinuclease ABC subunit A [bacterium]